MEQIFQLIGEVGFPIAGSLIAGYFIFLSVSYILQGVTKQVLGLKGIITALDNRVKTMNNDIIRVDMTISNVIGLKPDIDRIARADGKVDARRD
jgi:hypothetical protein